LADILGEHPNLLIFSFNFDEIGIILKISDFCEGRSVVDQNECVHGQPNMRWAVAVARHDPDHWQI
jgi:hypothetical protein